MTKIAITTGNKFNSSSIQQVEKLASELSIPYIDRNKMSIIETIKANKLSDLLVINKDLQMIWYKSIGSRLIYHPGMAAIRLKRLQKGEFDFLLQVMELEKCDSVLDCTLGFASDAIVLQYYLTSGKVTGLESQKLLALFVNYGLANYCNKDLYLLDAMKKINVLNVNHYDFLCKAAADSYDVVYFDPMFRNSKQESLAMQMYAPMADKSQITNKIINEAIRVTRKKVVLKERKGSSEFKRLGFKMIERPNIDVTFGIIEK